MKNEELKPCPFCGKENPFVGTENEIELDEPSEPKGYITVCCRFNDDGCGATSGYRPTREEAIRAWNKRT